MQISVAGLQRSGTTFIEMVLKKNFEGAHTVAFWKHAIEAKVPDNIGVVLVYKHPYRWIDSVIRYSADLTRKYTEIGATDTTKHMLQTKEEDGSKDLDLEKLIDLYNRYHRYWLNNKPDNFFMIYYADFISSELRTKQIFQNIQDKFMLTRVENRVDLVIAKKVEQSREFTESIRAYYQHFDLENINHEHLKVINNNIDIDVLNKLNLTLLDV